MSEELEFEKLENFANSEIVNNEDIFGYYIKKSYGQSFVAYDMINELGSVDLPSDVNYATEDIPTVVVFGNYNNPTQFVSMTFFTYDYELEEDEPLEVTGRKFKNNVFKLKNIIQDMDFCMISYPILNDSIEPFGSDTDQKYGLETIIFNTFGFLGGAYAKKNSEDKKNLDIQFLIPEGKIFPYSEITKKSYKSNNKEAKMFARILKDFHELPSFASEDTLNSLIEDIKKDRIKIITHTDAIKEELQSKVASLPLEGFILVDSDDRQSKEEWEQVMINMIAQSDTEKEEVADLINLVNNYFDNQEFPEEE